MKPSEVPLTLILGGARSGKSDYAERLASTMGERVVYVATAEALDDEMRARVANHQARRPREWITLEAPLNVGAELERFAQVNELDVILLDCLTLLVSNAVISSSTDGLEPSGQTAWASVRAEVEALLAIHQQLGVNMLIVSNEVGLGVVPAFGLGRVYRDCLGWANQAIARIAGQVVLMVAGLPVDLRALPLADLPDSGGC
jgi:adenosylcobinamide kinase/adenosylcobinamide-phosphate guanylyltransferase